jgi:hypothetical protein
MDALQQKAISVVKPLIPRDAEDRVRRTVKQFNGTIREHIRAETGLRLSDSQARSSIPVKVTEGFPAKLAGLLPPIGALKELGPAMDRIFATAAECVTYFERTLIEAGQQRDKVLRLAQALVQRLLLKNRDLIEAYAPCPCASGSKVMFCCGGGNVVTTR